MSSEIIFEKKLHQYRNIGLSNFYVLYVYVSKFPRYLEEVNFSHQLCSLILSGEFYSR